MGEEQGQSNVMCRICFCGENEGSERARRMLPCKTCGKKYHRNCLKTWAQHRGTTGSYTFVRGYRSHILIYWKFFADLFHWSSWACPSCRICEVMSDLQYLFNLVVTFIFYSCFKFQILHHPPGKPSPFFSSILSLIVGHLFLYVYI